MRNFIFIKIENIKWDKYKLFFNGEKKKRLIDPKINYSLK